MGVAKQVSFGTFEKEILANKIVDSLLKLIKARELLPGDRLPSERELAEMMKVSRPALREALRALAIMNVVDVRPGSGTYVTTLRPEQILAHLDFVFALDDSSIVQLFDARRTLELRTVTLAAQHVTDDEIAQVEDCMARMRGALGDDPEKCDELDQEFHRLVAAASRNPILARFVSVVNRLGNECRRRSHTVVGTARQANEDHQAILDALKARNPDAAYEAMLQHLQHAERNLRSVPCQ